MAREKQHTPCLSEHREPGRGTFSFVFFLGGGCKKTVCMPCATCLLRSQLRGPAAAQRLPWAPLGHPR